MDIRVLLEKQWGYYDYNDLATHTTPISVPNTNVWTKITNDGAGEYSNDQHKPTGDADLWNTATSQFDFSGLNYGDIVQIRYDFNIQTFSNNAEVIARVRFGLGSGYEYTRTIAHNHYKSTSSQENITVDIGEYIGSDIIKDYPAEVEISSDVGLNVTVNGWYIRVFKKEF